MSMRRFKTTIEIRKRLAARERVGARQKQKREALAEPMQ
jgi:hypothetical protein